MQVGDLVVSNLGNIAVITGIESCGIYLDVFFCKSGVLRTGFHRSKIRKVIKK